MVLDHLGLEDRPHVLDMLPPDILSVQRHVLKVVLSTNTDEVLELLWELSSSESLLLRDRYQAFFDLSLAKHIHRRLHWLLDMLTCDIS